MLLYVEMNSVNDSIISERTKSSECWYNDFAEKLLAENFLLTALEFHAELTESGKELSKLKDYFSNPRNFEHHVTTKPEALHSLYLPRSSSQATLDSLDLTRYSEDGERSTDDKVAILEFELRKARETISALRANLTEAAASETNKFTLQQENLQESQNISRGEASIKPHEQRALNFLINEYLLLNGYKLTSITFADENESQDFEDWEDVGLNCTRPLELLHLYREGLKSTGFSSQVETKDFECQVALNNEFQLTLHINELESEISELTRKMNEMSAELAKKTLHSETLLEDSQGSSTPDPEHFEIIETVKYKEESDTASYNLIGDWANLDDKNKKDSLDIKSDSHSYVESPTNNDKMETQFNILETSKSSKPDISNEIMKGEECLQEIKDEHSLQIRIDKLNEAGSDEFDTVVENTDKVEMLPLKNEESCHNVINLECLSRELPENFKNAIFKNCDMIIPSFSRKQIFPALFEKTCLENLTTDHVIELLSESLPKIIPSIILNKREEITPLLILSVCFNKDLSARDKLLNLLFNLKKKPDVEERKVILEALIVISKLKGSVMVENEILPQCWEQILHKYVERRLLVAESCFLLAPFVSETIRNSLIISITQQLLQDREETIRKAAVNILTILIALMSDEEKYSQVLEISLQLLHDESTDVVKSVKYLLIPTLAQWSFTLNRIQSHLFNKLLNKLKKEKSLFVLNIIEILLPYLILTIANSELLVQIPSDSHISSATRQDFYCLCKGLCDPAIFFNGSFSKVMNTFDFYTSQPEFTSTEWPEVDWIIKVFIPDLIEVCDESWENSKILKALMSILRNLCLGLGQNVTNFKVKPFLLQKLIECENAVVSGQNCRYSIIPLYLVGVLSTYPEELQEMSNTLRRFICALPLCGVSLIPLQVTVEILVQYKSWQILVLDAIWEGVVHQRPLVRGGSAILLNSVVPYIPEGLMSTKVMPALITLSSDPEASVRVNAVPALGILITTKEKAVKDKVYLTFQTLLQDSLSLGNHALIIQLVRTIIFIYEQCEPKFRNEVVVPQLFAMTTLATKTKSKDLIEVLIDAFSAVTYSQTQITSQYLSSAILPGLRNLENVCTQLTLPFSELLDSMIKEIERRLSGSRETSSKVPKTSPSSDTRRIANAISPHLVVEDVRNKVTKMFNTRPNTLQNVSGLFKKKT